MTVCLSACLTETSPRPITPSPLTVASVRPDNGPLAGGTVVTITGTNFIDVTAASVGGAALQYLIVVSDTLMTGTIPAAGSSGTRDVAVTSTSHGSATCTACFTYNPLPTVTAVSPDNGPLVGGTAVAITGANFADVTGASIGNAGLQNVIVVNSTKITGTVPASGSSGPQNVAVTSTSRGDGFCAACFTYNPLPTIGGVTPGIGLLSGGTSVTITGTGFPPIVDSVRFGSALLGSLVRVSGTQIVGVTPAGGTGSADVSVYAVSAGSASCTQCFTYLAAFVGDLTLVSADDWVDKQACNYVIPMDQTVCSWGRLSIAADLTARSVRGSDVHQGVASGYVVYRDSGVVVATARVVDACTLAIDSVQLTPNGSGVLHGDTLRFAGHDTSGAVLSWVYVAVQVQRPASCP